MMDKMFSNPLMNSMVLDIFGGGVPNDQRLGFVQQLHALLRFDSRSWFHEINVPTLIAHSIQDEPHFTREATLMAQAVRAQHRLVLRGGHASPLEVWRELASGIREFLVKVGDNEMDAKSIECA